MTKNFDSIELAKKIRISTLEMTSRARASHVGSALSCADILAVLYSKIVDIKKILSKSDDRDIIIFSKGHASSAFYSALAHVGMISLNQLESYCENESNIGGHVTKNGTKGVELSTGSLGHGFPFGVGVALARKRRMSTAKVFIIMSDGECNEGTTWESALIANNFALDNLIIIIDRNRLQSLGSTEDTLKLEPLKLKWEAFGFKTKEIDGHSHLELEEALNIVNNGPICIIANTRKGAGVSFMENKIEWHYKSPNDSELRAAIEELEFKNHA